MNIDNMASTDITPTKARRCPVCGENKELTADNWFRESSRNDGFASRCKVCDKAKTYARREADRERYNSDQRALYARKMAAKKTLKKIKQIVNQAPANQKPELTIKELEEMLKDT